MEFGEIIFFFLKYVQGFLNVCFVNIEKKNRKNCGWRREAGARLQAELRLGVVVEGGWRG